MISPTDVIVLAMLGIGTVIYLDCASQVGSLSPTKVLLECLPAKIIEGAGTAFDELGQATGIVDVATKTLMNPITQEILSKILPHHEVNLRTTTEVCQFLAGVKNMTGGPGYQGDKYDCKGVFDGIGRQFALHDGWTPDKFEQIRDFFKGIIKPNAKSGNPTVYAWIPAHIDGGRTYKQLVFEVELLPTTFVTYRSYYGDLPFATENISGAEAFFRTTCAATKGAIKEEGNDVISCNYPKFAGIGKATRYFDRKTGKQY